MSDKRQPGPEMNLAVAKAARIKVVPVLGPGDEVIAYSKPTVQDDCISPRLWEPTGDWTDAMEAAEKVGLFDPDGYCGSLIKVGTETGPEWSFGWLANGVAPVVYAATGPAVICKAILALKGATDG